MEEFVNYKSFNDEAIATELCRQLTENGIPFKWESTEGFFDASFTTNDILNLYYVKLRKEDFSKADELLTAEAAIDQPTNDYYLLSFTDNELIDVLKNPDEWNEFDRYWAKKILATRGIEVKQEEIESAKEKKLQQLKQPWRLDKVWVFGVITLIILAIFLIHILMAIAVVLGGAYIVFSKKTMPDGDRVTAFSYGDRILGKIAIVVGIGLSVFILSQYYGVIDFVHPF